MVKVDYNREYYRDLELQPGADLVQIKKQFKKLALRYHPDRNPGKELEFNSKFQAIQSAHEVLSDPDQRLKYDANLKRTGRFYVRPTPPPPKPSPLRKPTTTTGQPNPTRPPPPSTQRPKYTSTPSSGASRYADFGSGPWMPPPRQAYDAQARTDTYRKWEHMTQAQHQARQNAYPPPPPPNVPPRATPPNGASAYARQKARESSPRTGERPSAADEENRARNTFPGMSRSQSTRIPRKNGFDPGTPGGDEPAAPNTSAYFNTSRGERPSPARWSTAFPEATKPRAPTAKKADPLDDLRRSASDDHVATGSPRVRTPYAATGGEKTFLSGAGLGRSATTREVPKRTDWNGTTPSRHETTSGRPDERGRSASPKAQNPNGGPRDADSTSSSADSMNIGVGANNRRFKKATGVRGSRIRRPPAQPGARFKPFVEPDSSDDDGRTQSDDKNAGHRNNENANKNDSSAYATSTSADRIRNWQQGFPDRWEPGPEKLHNNIFNIPVNDQTFEKTSPSPVSPSKENPNNINTAFSPQDWHGIFTGNPREYFINTPPGRKSPARGRPSSRSDQEQSQKPMPTQSPPFPRPVSENVPPNSQPKADAQTSPPRKFSADEWKNTFKEPSFVFPTAPQAVSPNRPNSRAPKSSRSRDQLKTTVKRPKVPKPASVSAVTDDASEEENTLKDPDGNGGDFETRTGLDGGGMDVDPSGPKPTPATTGSSITSVEPTKSKWRGDGATPNETKPTQEPHTRNATEPVKEPPPAPKTEEPELDLSNLNKVEPLAPGQHGLKNLNDLSDTLPFESRAAAEPINKPAPPARLALPDPPKGPTPPVTVNSETWKPYLESMRVYFSEWRSFNKRMLMHFNSRQDQVDLDLGPDFLGTIGEGPKGGLMLYMQGLEEDFRVRAHWDVSYERHRTVMVAFCVFKQQLLHAAQLVMSRIEELPDDFDSSVDLNKVFPDSKNNGPSSSDAAANSTSAKQAPTQGPSRPSPEAPGIPTSVLEQAVPFPLPADYQNKARSNDPTAKTAPSLPPQLESVAARSPEELLEFMNRTPLFMSQLDETDGAGGENLELEAIRAMQYEGTRLEIAKNFREQGNDCVRTKQWRDANEFYTKGVATLSKKGKDKEELDLEEDDRKNGSGLQPEQREKEEKALLEVMYANRALGNLELKNYRRCNLDCATALVLNPRNIKAWYRSSLACLALDKIPEALDACQRGLEIDAANTSLKSALAKITTRKELLDKQARQRKEREERKLLEQRTLKAALQARNIPTRTTGHAPETEDARVHLAPDPVSPTSTLQIPVLLLYPMDLQSDIIKAFAETDTLGDHLSYILPLPWDEKSEYFPADKLECFVETSAGGLLKLGQKVPLLKLLAGGKVEIVDDLLKIFVLPKTKAKQWIEEFKAKRANGATA
ncbi:hypothetical protein L228DRAFT_236297 [Xylona heveae TC161]|uniref:J domain-containing protein n=1 Tax=Xylona heveae (strain CBS 132557 / TC161) TaxID=1328760 RepID=A0A165IP13_XYLHT|nr:hypothetical protein L228DRAFT_236297 [Xylona heveae TC161]KZF25176.1 hypothetical protein L228DRAFT_236297 [Xylona heveae TC161]